MQKDELIETLLGIDEEAWLLLGSRPVKPRVVVVGGAAFMLRDLTTRRVTHDIDVLQADEAVQAIITNYPQVNEQVGPSLIKSPITSRTGSSPFPYRRRR